MSLNDIQTVLQWWAMLFLLGIGFLPVTMRLFSRFYDKGYIFSKVLGMAITSYAVFLLGLLHIVPFGMITSYGILLGLFAASYALSEKETLLATVKKYWPRFLLSEGIFLISLLCWSYIHGFGPDIHGLEKYMDYGFINSILRAEYFPPKDMWFTPLYINYYYFGHLMTAVLTKLSGLPVNYTFNIMLATIFAFCFTQTFSIGSNLFSFMLKSEAGSRVKRIIAGFLTAAVVSLGGNLHILYAFFKPYDVDKPLAPWDLTFLPLTFPNSYWYPNATRYIYHTIHEFPLYSWVVADLHGHVLDIPFVLFIVALLLSIFMNGSLSAPRILAKKINLRITQIKFHKAEWKFGLPELLLIGFLLAVMYMTNAWDGAIYLLLALMVLGTLQWQLLGKSLAWIKTMSITSVVLVGTFAVVLLPYNIFFKPFVSGIGVLCAPEFLTKVGKIGPFLFEAQHCQHSFWWELLFLYGFFYFFIACFLTFMWKAKKLIATDYFVSILITLGTMLIFIPEFIYVKDIYPAHYRANTMFKLVFQAFMLLGISSSYIIFRLLSLGITDGKAMRKRFFYPFLILTVLLLIAVMQYPKLAINSYYGDLKTYKGLDGAIYIKTLYPTDYDAIMWLNKNVKGQPVILEAQGDSYTDFGRVSANTGLPTVLGWTVHEWLWRGIYDIPAPRIEEVKKMYETRDAAVAKKLLDKYHVKYVFIGSMEFQKYPELSEGKFGQLGKIVFQQGTTKIYQIN